MSDITNGLMSVKEMGKTSREIAESGFHVVLPGTAYHTVVELLERLRTQATDNHSLAFIVDLQATLEYHAIPVKARLGDTQKATD